MKQYRMSYNYDVKIGVIGIGGSGCNVLRDISLSLKESRVDLLAINTDAAALKGLSASTLSIGSELTRGLGAGADSEIGRLAAESSRDQIASSIAGLDIVLLVGGLGGGTGTGAAPVVANIAKAGGALCIALVTTPFAIEGAKRSSAAKAGLSELLKRADSVYVHSNEEMLNKLSSDVTLLEAFAAVNQRLIEIIRNIVLLYRAPGLITIDLQDLRMIFEQSGRSAVGMGRGSGPNRAVEAATGALDDLGIADALRDAKGVIVIVRAPADLLTSEFSKVGDHLKRSLPDAVTTILGSWVDSSIVDELIVTVIVTGVDSAAASEQRRPLRSSKDLEDPPIAFSSRQAHPMDRESSKPIYLLAPDTLSHPRIAELIEHLSALYRSVGGDELVITSIDHVTPLSTSASAVRSKQFRRTG